MDRQAVTQMMRLASTGDRDAAARLLPEVYSELRALAAARLARTPPGNTLQATALVHEAYLKLVGTDGGLEPEWDSRAHFFGAAARAMRDILVDQARRKAAVKHGGDVSRASLEAEADLLARIAPPPEAGNAREIIALDAALAKLEVQSGRQTEIVLLRVFAGLNHSQIALSLGVSVATVDRDWRFARAWLQNELGRSISEV